MKFQYKISLSRGKIGIIDLIYFKEDEIIIIELKRQKIEKKNISQLSDYVYHLKKLFPAQKVRGILIGQTIKDELKMMLDFIGFSFKSYFEDITFSLKICKNCRKLVELKQIKCKWCSTTEFLPF